MKKEQYRKLNAIERMHIRQPNANVILAAKIQQNLSKEKVEQALIQLSKVHPLINSKISIDETDVAWFSIKKVCNIPVNIVDNQSWDQVVVNELKIPYDVFTGPLIRFKICIHDTSTYLIINAHHAICDGLALIYLLKDLLSLIDGSSMNHDVLNPPTLNEDIIPLNYSNLLIKKLVGLTNKKWLREQIELTNSGFDTVHENFWKKHNPRIHHWILSENQTKRFIKCCKEHNVSVNSALTTAFMIAQKHIEQKKDYLDNVVISVDFRNKLIKNAGESFGKFASSIRPKLTSDYTDDFWIIAKKNDIIIKNELNNKNIFASQKLNLFAPSLIDALSYQKNDVIDSEVVRRLVSKMKLNDISIGLIITNLGLLSIPVNYGSIKLDEIYGPFVFSDTMEKYVGIITFNNRLSISISYGDPYIDSKTIIDIKQQFQKIIENLL